jgi:hypothetical protein
MLHQAKREWACADAARVCLLAAWMLFFITAAAQSGKILPQPTPTPTPPSASAATSELTQNPDAAGDIYKLVFPTEYYGKLSYDLSKEKEKELFWRVRESWFETFIGQLNKLGEQSFELKFASVNAGLPLAILQSDDHRYEYNWFENYGYLALPDFEGGYTKTSYRGFRLFENYSFDVDCNADPDDLYWSGICKSSYFFLLERVKGDERPKQFTLVVPQPHWRPSKALRDMLAGVNDGMSRGFYPTHLLSVSIILLEPPEKDNEAAAKGREFQVIRDSSLEIGSLLKHVNELAQQGYRLDRVNTGIALMSRPVGTAIPTSYIWLDAKKKDFDEQLARLQAEGAIFRLAFPDYNGLRTRLIFEQPPMSGGKRHEYKVLKFDLQSVEDLNISPKNGPVRKVSVSLTPESKETEKLMNSLAREGFVVRGLLVLRKGYGILLERAFHN